MKEWKGNSNSTHAAIAAHNGKGKSDRQEDDFYATDPEALERLIGMCHGWLYDMLSIARKSGIWECACGNGNLAECLKKYFKDVHATDLKDRGYGIPHIDFLHIPISGYRVILTNPPYSLANEFILHALDILPDGGVYIALMNISYLCGQKRYETIYSKGTLREVYLFKKRIECWRNNDKETYGGKAMVDFAWYVFQKGYNGQPTLYWL